MINVKEHIRDMIPEPLRMAQLVVRRAPRWKAAGLIFVHIPKNGGTSINNAIYGRFMGHFRVRDIEHVRPNLLETMPSFAVTRNPWSRAYSAWNFAIKGVKMQDGAQIRNPERYRASEFQSFERFVLEWLQDRDLAREDYVFRPQVHYLLDTSGNVGVKKVGQIEDPLSYLEYLTENIGRPVKIKHLNRTNEPQRYRYAYTPEMRDALANVYSSDLEKFNYDF